MKNEKKETTIGVGGRLYGKDDIIELKKQCCILSDENSSLKERICSLNRQIGGYKQSNANYKKAVSDRDRANSRNKEAYDKKIIELEARYNDELEQFKKKHLAEFNDYKRQRDNELSTAVKQHEKVVAEKQKVADGLSQQVQELACKNRELESMALSDKEYINEMEITIEELRKPWWKKIF